METAGYEKKRNQFELETLGVWPSPNHQTSVVVHDYYCVSSAIRGFHALRGGLRGNPAAVVTVPLDRSHSGCDWTH